MGDVRPLRPDDPELIGGYRLLGVLGAGGQGVVYQGADGQGRHVAIKLLHGHLSGDKNIRRRFLQEVEATRRVAAFCTAAVLDVGTHAERPYIVSEFVTGDTLAELVQTSGPRSGGGLDRVAIATLTALAAIHRAGIVHRDFKPANVLMGPEGPIVIDFGIAKALDATTMVSGPIGTPAYMSPEQIKGDEIGPASDLFSWAGTMVFAATARTPFPGNGVPAVLNGILNGTPDLTGVPPHLVNPIEQCLAKDPASRPTPDTLLLRLTGRPVPSPASPTPRQAPGPGRPIALGRPVGPGQPVGSGEATGPGQVAGAGPTGDDDTQPRRDRAMTRRTLLAGVSAVVAAGATGVAIWRAGEGHGDALTHTPSATPTPATSGSASGPPTTSPTPSGTSTPAPSTATTTPAATPTVAVPTGGLGTPVTDPVKLPAKHGAPVALAAFGGLVVCGGAKGQVVAWDLDSGAGAREVHTAAGAADAVAVGEIGGSRMVASGHADGTYRISTLEGERVASHKAADPIIAVTLSGTPVAVSQRYDPMKDLTSVVRFWNIVTGEQIGKKFTGHFQGVNGLAFGRIEYDDVLVTGDNKGRLRLWKVRTGTLLRTYSLGLNGGIERLACGRIDDRPVVVSTHLDATLRVYDLTTGKRRGKWSFSDISPDDRFTAAVAVTDLDGVPVAAVVHRPYGGDQTLRLWNLTNGVTIDEVPGGGNPLALTVAELTGRPIAVLSEESRILRAWSLGSP